MNWQVTTYHWHMLNERLKNLRLAKGLTLQQVGDVFGISAASVASWEKGKNQPDSRKLSKLAVLLGTTVEFLLNGSGDSSVQSGETQHDEVPFIEWHEIGVANKSDVAGSTARPLHSKLSSNSFATRFPGSTNLTWSQGPVPAGALIFIDPSKKLQPDTFALVKNGIDATEIARVELPTKPSGYFMKLISTGETKRSDDGLKIIGTIVEWRISGKL